MHEKIVTKVKQKYSNTYMVNKKCNYKECPICKKLYMNITDHLKQTHKMKKDDENYDNYVKNCTIVPKCYTKKIGGTTRRLTNESLIEAQEENQEKIRKQQVILDNLRSLREEIEKNKRKPQSTQE